MLSGLEFYRPQKTEEGILFECAVANYLNLRRVLSCINVEWESETEGLFGLFWAKRRRIGLAIGAIIGIFFIYLSTFFVWGVKIEGNGEVPVSEIVDTLAKHGFYEGALKSRFDVNEVAASFLADRSEFSFCSINISGAVAHVELHPLSPTRFSEPENDPYNLISDADGIIVRLEVENGMSAVKLGDSVHKGQLLVSGIMENTVNTAFRLVRAEGRVWARVNKTLSFSVPLEYTEKKYTSERSASRLKILGKKIGFARVPSKGDYDIISSVEIPEIFGCELPFGIERILYAFYVEKVETLTEEEALVKAHDLYRKRAVTEFDGATILEESFSHKIKNGELILTCEVCAVEEITTREKIEVK